MPSEIVMPRLGWTMEVGRVVEWLKADGDTVAVGDLILSIESDKAVTEVEALDAGILRIPADPQIGVELPVGAPLGLILSPGEALSFDSPATDQTDPPSPLLPPQISPRARRIAAELAVDWTTLTGSGSSGRIREVDIRAAVSTRPPVAKLTPAQTRATPDVRRLAAESGVDLTTLTSARPGGRLTRADILAASASPRPLDPLAPSVTEPVSAIRRVIIQRMTETARTVAPVTLTTDADATDLVQIRARLTEEVASGEVVPSYGDLIARLVALALSRHPALNASLETSGDQHRIVQHAGVHLGIAVDTERGLLVPVVRDADRKSAFAIAAESADLIAAARAGTATADMLGGATFTVTNLGMYGVDAFTPIINLPECAVLGLGRIVARAVVIDEETEAIAVRKMMALSLTFDHRVVDGAPAARFLQTVRQMIERPIAWLLR